MKLTRAWIIGVWLAFIIAGIVVICHTKVDTDLSAFLPRSPSPAQQVLVDQLRSGVVSRLILIAVQGRPPAVLAQTNIELAVQLRTRKEFVAVNNGEEVGIKNDRDFLWRNRYLLSSAISSGHFSAAALHAAMEEDLQWLESPAAILLQHLLPQDPTGELLRLIDQLEETTVPTLKDGVWFSKDGTRTLLVVQTRAAGSDLDAQQRALGLIKDAFADAVTRTSATNTGVKPTLLMIGPAVFSVNARKNIKTDAWRFSVIAASLVAMVLLMLYRSPRVLVLGLLPVASGALAGMSAVSLVFGSIHGVTLGFGTTLIGEGVDYAIYLFTQMMPGILPNTALNRIWPTLRLGVVTSICGFSAMLLSDFLGLAQLGLFSIVGLIVAVIVTRYVLPVLLPADFTIRAVTGIAGALRVAIQHVRALRYPLIVGVAAATLFLFLRAASLWNDDLASLSPIPQSDQRLDEQLRQDVGAPDARYLIVINASTQESALEKSEDISRILGRLIREGALGGYESPTLYLPSLATQRNRKAALPDTQTLRASLEQAARGLPFRPGLFAPFVRDVQRAREQSFLDINSLAGTHFALKVDSLLINGKNGWTAMLPLRDVIHPSMIAQGIDVTGNGYATLVDLKQASDQLYRTYREETVRHALLGVVAIALFLGVMLRSPHRVFNVLAPLAAAVIITTTLLLLTIGKLSIFHLIGLLLVVAVGSNYSLFFERCASFAPERERTLASVLFANISTVIGFGVLAFSKVPVLNAIGSTVAIGTMLSLVFSAVLIAPESPLSDSPV